MYASYYDVTSDVGYINDLWFGGFIFLFAILGFYGMILYEFYRVKKEIYLFILFF